MSNKETIIDFMVIEKKLNGDWSGHGSRAFRVAPRVGDYVSFDDSQGVGQAYEVIAVLHPLDLASTAGDLIIRHRGTDLDLRASL